MIHCRNTMYVSVHLGELSIHWVSVIRKPIVTKVSAHFVVLALYKLIKEDGWFDHLRIITYCIILAYGGPKIRKYKLFEVILCLNART